LSREEALVKMARIFFESRGPATVKDFSKWMGLSMADARNGLEAVKAHLQTEEIEGKTYWFSGTPAMSRPKRFAYLLPNYDEYISSYADYSFMADIPNAKNLENKGNAAFWSHVVIDGLLVGSWRRTFPKNDTVKLELSPFTKFTKTEMASIEKAAKDFGRFLERSVEIGLC
jgi:hypothetical protein